jgi:hypothetical protein
MKAIAAFAPALLLAGCMSVPLGYPDDWTPLQAAPESGACPALAGAYAEPGDTPSGCAAASPCARLSFGLFAGMAGLQGEAALSASEVEIRQPAPEALEIIVRDGGRERARKMLSAAKGDFRCTRRGLTLVARGGRTLVAGGAPIHEERTFNRAQDGALVMLREAVGSDQHVVVPVGLEARYWVRWVPAAPQGPARK